MPKLIHPAGLFEARVGEDMGAYKVEVRYPDGTTDQDRRPVPVLADARRSRSASHRRGPPREVVGGARRAPPRATRAPPAPRSRCGRRRRRARAGGRRLQLLGRPHPPDALARLVRRLGAVRARRRAGRKYKFEVVGADGAAAAEGRPDGACAPRCRRAPRRSSSPTAPTTGTTTTWLDRRAATDPRQPADVHRTRCTSARGGACRRTATAR